MVAAEDGGVEPRKSGKLTPAEKANIAPVVPETHEHNGYGHWPESRQDRAARPREKFPGVPAVACSGQALPRHLPATA